MFIIYYVNVLLLIETVMSLRISCESLQGFRERFQLLPPFRALGFFGVESL